MKSTFVCLSVIAFFSCAISAVPSTKLIKAKERCNCAPPQWEGVVAQSQGLSVKGDGHAAAQTMRLSIDSNLKKVAATGEWFYDQSKGKFQVLEDYNEGVKYQVTDGKCTKSPLDKSLWPNCAPKGSIYMSTAKVGLGNDSIIADSYALYLKGDNMNAEVYYQVTAKDCVPIGNMMRGTINGVGVMNVQGVTDISPGIKDPSVFNIPSPCQKDMEINSKAPGNLMIGGIRIGY